MFDITKKAADDQDDLNKKLAERTPLPQEDVQNLQSYAQHICNAMRQSDPQFGFDADSVKLLSDSIDRERAGYSDDLREKLANLFGAYLGHVITLTHRDLHPVWVRVGNDIGIELTEGEKLTVVFPITRVFKQIDEGEMYSIYFQFAAIRDIFAGM